MNIKNYADVIEKRIDDSGIEAKSMIEENQRNLDVCKEYGHHYIMIDDTYEVVKRYLYDWDTWGRMDDGRSMDGKFINQE